MKSTQTLLLLCISMISHLCYAQTFRQHSVLAEGSFYKLGVAGKGLYRIDYDFLLKNGIDPKSINPKHLRLFGNRGGMLPQGNNVPVMDDLAEIAILVSGEEDGSFDKEDYMLFYAEGPDRIYYDDAAQRFVVEKNLYDDQNYYFLKVDQQPGKRISGQLGLAYGWGIVIETYDDVIHHEKDLTNILKSGRYWYGEEFSDEQQTLSLNFLVPGIVEGEEMIMHAAVVSRATEKSHFTFSWAGRETGSIEVEAAQATLYGYKAREKQQQFSVPVHQTPDSVVNLQIHYETSSGHAGYLDHITLQMKRKLALYGAATFFRSLQAREQYIGEYRVNHVTQHDLIWDITNPLNVKSQEFNIQQQQASFKVYTDTLKEFVVFRKDYDFPAPEFMQPVSPQDLHALLAPNLLIVTTDLFQQEAQRLAQFRREHDKLSTAVVLTEHIYNEFSSGRQDVSATRNFIRMLYERSDQLRYVLLFGDASYDYQQRVEPNTNHVPTYQSYNSMHDVHSYASDDYFGFLETHEGVWAETGNNYQNEHDLEVGIGRLPVNTIEDARAVVDKLLHYSSHGDSFGDWRKNIVFVADDGDNNKHQLQSDYLASFLEEHYPELNSTRIFLDAYPQEDNSAPEVRKVIDQQIARGALMVDFIGHGGETAWTNENILDVEMINHWSNYDRLPLLLTATCEFGRYDDPKRSSGAELALLNPKGGAIGLLTTTRPVFSNTNFMLSSSFYQTAFKPSKNEPLLRLGDIFRIAKNKSIAGTVNRNFSLLGDPSMRLAYPQKQVVLETINGKPVTGADSLLPLQPVTVSGTINHQNRVDSTFNGKVQITFFGHASEITTLGDEGSEMMMSFQNREQKLFKGTASVKNGKFTAHFILPKSIPEDWKNGKISFYAVNERQTEDAAGSYTSLLLGGSPMNEDADHVPPEIQLYLNDERFISGNPVYPQPVLIAKLRDESGIDISGQPHGIQAIIDDDPEQYFILNDWYEASLDDFTQGSIAFPVSVLSPGKHILTLQASDIYGNTSQKSIVFSIVNDSIPIASNFTAYPNPTAGATNFSFFYSQPHEIQVSLTLYSGLGQPVFQTRQHLQPDENGYVTLHWGKGDSARMIPGLYVYRLMIENKDQSAQLIGEGKLIIR